MSTFAERQGTGRECRAKRACSIAAVCGIWLALALAPQAKAGFIGYYSLSDFTLINTCTDVYTPCMAPDGTAFTSGDSIVIVGGHNGSGESGVTDLVITAAGSGVVQFQYSYSSLDGIGFDYAGYLLNGVYYQLADTDGEASAAGDYVTLTVTAGEVFGFRVGTVDNLGEPGVLTVSDFSAPAAASVPEPTAASLMVVSGVVLYVLRKVKCSVRRGRA